MLHHCLLTVPGLDVRVDWRRLHDRLLDEFPAVTHVLPTTMPETLLIVHKGAADDAWIDVAAATLLFAHRPQAPCLASPCRASRTTGGARRLLVFASSTTRRKTRPQTMLDRTRARSDRR